MPSASFRLRLDTTEAQRAIRNLRQLKPPAVVRALNRSGGSAKTLLVQSIAKDLAIKSSTVRDKILQEDANTTHEIVRLRISGARLPLITFNAKAVKGGGGITARLPGGAGTYPHAFFAIVGVGQHKGVFQRVGRGRLPIVELRGPSLPHVFIKYATAALNRGRDQLMKNLQSEFRYAVRQAARK